MSIGRLAILIGIALCARGSVAERNPNAIDAYLRPYVRSENFAGVVLVEKSGKVVFEKAYGFADREHRVRNTPATRFHIASMSMQFTAGAILRLVDEGSIKLDGHVGEFVPGIEGADKITIRDLLTERSGLPDINSLPDYADVLQHHQTPASLVAKIKGQSIDLIGNKSRSSVMPPAALSPSSTATLKEELPAHGSLPARSVRAGLPWQLL
ncbi:MAG: beta-lactamase family protein [Acidobacteriia bacterium]|nr:beta-lactamase family protein [Terriglobia bacterium]